MGVPWQVLPPTVFYVIEVGVSADGMLIFKYGIADCLKTRCKSHAHTWPAMRVRFVVSLGTHSAAKVEDSVSVFLRALKVKVDLGNSIGTESFAATEEQSDHVLAAVRAHVERKYADMVQYSSLDGDSKTMKNTMPAWLPNVDSAEVEAEKTKQITEQEITKRVGEEAKVKLAEEATKVKLAEEATKVKLAEEATKIKLADVEIMQLRIEMLKLEMAACQQPRAV